MAADVPIEGLFGCFSLDVLELTLLTLPEKRVFEHQVVIVLFDLVKVIHVELNEGRSTWRTKLEKLPWRKYLGRISRVKATTSLTTKPTPSFSQLIMYSNSGCLVTNPLPTGSSKS